MLQDIPPEVRTGSAGALGALIALLFMRKPWFIRAGMFVGGCVLAWLGGEWLAAALDMQRASGLVGFLLGLFGMAFVAKLYDTIEAIDPKDLWERICKRAGF